MKEEKIKYSVAIIHDSIENSNDSELEVLGLYDSIEDTETELDYREQSLYKKGREITAVTFSSHVIEKDNLENYIKETGYEKFLIELFMYEKSISKTKAKKIVSDFLSNNMASYLEQKLFEEVD